MTSREVEEGISRACSQLYAEQRRLIANSALEDGIVGRLARYLDPLFPGWDVDAHYNREGAGRKSKQDGMGLIIPDIVIHTAGVKAGPNLVAIEVKGYWNTEDREEDETNLKRLAAEYGYEFLFRVELRRETFELIRVTA
ncbi:MAG: hypothetical protein Q8M19_14205 [Reyranella sp.]|nr:hypothetical protein [Reyranella sp.]